MDETKLCSIAQLEEFLKATPALSFSGVAGTADNERYGHISRVLKRFDYPRRNKRERGVVPPCTRGDGFPAHRQRERA